jgi:hypothetical protein
MTAAIGMPAELVAPMRDMLMAPASILQRVRLIADAAG